MKKKSETPTTPPKQKYSQTLQESAIEAHCVALADLYDTEDLTVPWDWRAQHMEEIEARSRKKKPDKEA